MVIDLTRKFGLQREDLNPAEVGIAPASFITDHPDRSELVVVTHAQRVEEIYRDNQAERDEEDRLRPYPDGLGRKIASIPIVDFLADQDLAEAIATNNDAALRRIIARHPEWQTTRVM